MMVKILQVGDRVRMACSPPMNGANGVVAGHKYDRLVIVKFNAPIPLSTPLGIRVIDDWRAAVPMTMLEKVQ